MFDPTSAINLIVGRSTLPVVTGMALLSLACTDTTGPLLSPTESCVDQQAAALVSFLDSNLDAAVKNALGLGANGRATCGMVGNLEFVDANFSGITDLTGIQNLTGVTELYFAGNFIVDTSPLTALTGLRILDLGENEITDISPLSLLTELVALGVNENSISDISPVAGLTDLEVLALDGNAITDIGALTGLGFLQRLTLHDNQISDVSVLGDFASLEILDLGENPVSDVSTLSGHLNLAELGLDLTLVTDISALEALEAIIILKLTGNSLFSNVQPLLDNSNLGPGVTVFLEGTDVSCIDVSALIAKKLTVISNC